MIPIPCVVGNPLVTVAYTAQFTYFLPLPETETINNRYYGECNEYATSDITWGTFYDQGVMDTGIQK